MVKRISDRERLEYVKQYKTSGLSVSEFAKRHNLARCTLRDWINAFESISGDFIQVNPSLAEKGDFMKTGEVRMNMLSHEQITGKSRHFTRFDHSIVVIEFNGLKITTSLEHARAILRDYYGKDRD